jgi:hypothetical protein
LKTSTIFSVEIPIEKNGRRKNVNSKQMCVSSQKGRMRKEEGATVAASHLPSLTAGCLVVFSSGRTGSVSMETTLQEAPINTENVLLTNETPAKFSDI